MDATYIERFVECVNALGLPVTLTADQVTSTARRDELGISSLDVILVVDTYARSRGAGVAIRPEWVSRFDDVAGIVSVLQEIDATAADTVPAP